MSGGAIGFSESVLDTADTSAHFLNVTAAKKEGGDERIASDAEAAKFFGAEATGEAAGVGDVDSVVEDFDHDVRPFEIVVAVAEGIDDGFAEGDVGEFLNLGALSVGDFVASFEVLFEKEEGVVDVLENGSGEVLAV